MSEFTNSSQDIPIERTVYVEKPRSELLDSMAKNANELADGLVKIDGKGFLNQPREKLIAEGLRIAKDFVSSKQSGMPEKGLIEKFRKSSAKTIRKYFTDRNINPSLLLNSPAEAIAGMFSLDQETARSILEVFGIQVKSLSPAVNGIGSFEQRAMAVQTIGTLLMASRDQKADTGSSSAPPPPRDAVDLIPNVVAKGAYKTGQGIGRGLKISGAILVGVIGLGLCAGTIGAIAYYTDVGGGRSAIAKAAFTPTPTVIVTPPPTVPAETAVFITNKNIADKKYQEYQDTTSYAVFDPLDINSPPTQSLLSFYGPYWWYINNEGVRGYMDKVFAKDLTPEQITRIKQNKEEIFTVLEEARTKAETDGNKTKADKFNKAINWYKQRKEFTGKEEQFLIELQNSSSRLLPQQNLLNAQIVSQKMENISGLLSHGAYSGRKGSFANSGLPKSELLKRQRG